MKLGESERREKEYVYDFIIMRKQIQMNPESVLIVIQVACLTH